MEGLFSTGPTPSSFQDITCIILELLHIVFVVCISCTSDHSPLPALFEVTLAHACFILHTSSHPRAFCKLILKLSCKLYPAFKVFPYVMSGIGTKNTKQRTECLKEIGRVVVYVVVTLAFSINRIVIVIY